MFYAYILRHPETNQAFYVGKGQGNRPENHIKEAKKKGYGIRANRYKVNKIRSILNDGLEVKIEKIAAPSEKHAFEIEELLILMYGRIDNGTGILTNLTDGGEGTAGIDHTGSKNPNYGNTGELSAWFGRKHTEETKLKISVAQKGRIFSEEHKEKMRKPKSVKPPKIIVNCPHCKKQGERRAMKRWHFNNCRTLENLA